MIQGVITQILEKALKELGLPGETILLEHPTDMSHGDFSCNVAMVLAKQAKRKPQDIADEIVRCIELNKSEEIEKVEVAGPGFINFYLSREFFVDSVESILETGKDWGKNEALKGKKVMVEYTDPNPFKELHIGHLVPNALGESLSRLSEYSGAEVRRVTFQGDVGMHVAKAIWGLRKNGFDGTKEILPADLGKGYATGATAFDEDESIAGEIKKLNKVIYERSDDAINQLYDAGKKASIEYFEEAYRILGSDFDNYFFESATGPRGLEVVKEHVGDVFKESDGAIVFEGEEYGLHTRVFVNSEGLPTYEAKDIGLALLKYEWWPFDTAITVTGTEQESYFNVVKKAIEMVSPEFVGKLTLVPNGMLRLSEGKMSSRTGDVISALSLIHNLTEKVSEKMKEGEKTLAQDIAVAAIKYTVLRNSAGKDIVFDTDASISFEGDSGPYLQYTNARIYSILEKAASEGVEESTEAGVVSITDVERLLYRFPEVVERASYEYEPHYVTTYLTELAGAFNSWYAQEKILDGTQEAGYKLALAHAVSTTLTNGLWVLGIKAPERM